MNETQLTARLAPSLRRHAITVFVLNDLHIIDAEIGESKQRQCRLSPVEWPDIKIIEVKNLHW